MATRLLEMQIVPGTTPLAEVRFRLGRPNDRESDLQQYDLVLGALRRSGLLVAQLDPSKQVSYVLALFAERPEDLCMAYCLDVAQRAAPGAGGGAAPPDAVWNAVVAASVSDGWPIGDPVPTAPAIAGDLP